MERQTVFALLFTSIFALAVAGCSEEKKPETQKVIDDTKKTANDAGNAIKDTAQKTGKAIENTAAKTWDGAKDAARDVSNTATNVAGEVKAGAEKAVKGAFKQKGAG